MYEYPYGFAGEESHSVICFFFPGVYVCAGNAAGLGQSGRNKLPVSRAYHLAIYAVMTGKMPSDNVPLTAQVSK